MTTKKSSILLQAQAQLLIDVYRNYLITGDRQWKVHDNYRNNAYGGTEIHIDYIIDALRRKKWLTQPLKIKSADEDTFYTLEINGDLAFASLEKVYDKGLSLVDVMSILS